MSRLDILRLSLEKKQAEFDRKLAEHFGTVAQSNGQPLNDKRNGSSTLAKWDRQNNGLRRLSDGIEATKAAIEREEALMKYAASIASDLPAPISERMATGLLSQWRRHPRTFFVVGVEKARIVLLNDGRVAHRYASAITDPDQRRIFARTYNELSRECGDPK